ncbi:MAG TPA: hypothetical protein VJL39_01500 [Candidatus Paceibacterota bacterium]
MTTDIKVKFTPLDRSKVYESTFAFPASRLFLKRAVDIGKGRVCRGKSGFKGEIGEVDAYINDTFIESELWDKTEVPSGAEIELREVPPADEESSLYAID